jgi:cyclophilin family peptidyl-prolyl cis-trans isomerase/HEAT repeat protein
MSRKSVAFPIPMHLAVPAVLLALTLVATVLGGCQQEGSSRLEAKHTLARWEDARLAPRDSLVAMLTGPDAHIRLAAIRSAGLIGRTDVLPELIAALDDPSVTVCRQAAYSLGLLGDERALPALNEAAGAPRPDLRESALAALGRISNNGTILLQATAATSETEASLAWDGLRNTFAEVDSMALRDAVTAGLTRPETEIQWRVLRCLERFAPSDLTSLIAPFTTSDNPQVRVHAYRALALRNSYPALQAVMAGWSDHDQFRDRSLARVQINGLRALGRLAKTIDVAGLSESATTAAREDVAALLIIGAGNNNAHVAETALVAMSACVVEAPLPAEAAEQESLLPVWRIRLARSARSHLDDEPLGVRIAALAAWANLRGAGAGEELLSRLGDSVEPRIQAALVRAAGRILPDPQAILEQFAQRQYDAQVREAALTGLIDARENWPTHLSEEIRQQRETADLALLIAATKDPDFVVATTAAGLLRDFPSAPALTALCELWDSAAGPDRSDLQLGVLSALKQPFPVLPDSRPVFSSSPPDSSRLRIRLSDVLRRAFDSPDIRIRLEAREAALESGLLPERLIPQAASLRATLPPFKRDSRQPAVAVPGPAPEVRCLTDRGEFVIRLDGELAPNTCAVFQDLIARGYYENLIFHRVVPDFVVQGGDPRGDGWGGPGYTIRSEWSATPYRRAAVGIAHSGKDTGGSQFFVTLSEQPHLNGRYTVFGEVTKGMDVVDRIQVGDRFSLEIIQK